MLQVSDHKESFTHSIVGGISFGVISALITSYYSQEIDKILLSGVTQGSSTLATAFVNLRAYNLAKVKFFEKTDSVLTAKWGAATTSAFLTFLSTALIQELSVGEGSTSMGLVYALLTFLALPTMYEQQINKNKLLA